LSIFKFEGVLQNRIFLGPGRETDTKKGKTLSRRISNPYYPARQQKAGSFHQWRRSCGIGMLAKVRDCANTGLVLGTESSREQVQRLPN